MTVETIAHRQPEAVAHFPGLVSFGRVARQSIRGALLWGSVFTLVTWLIVNEYATSYPTVVDRARVAETMGTDVGSQAIFGPAHHLDTVAGYLAYHAIALFSIIGGVWGLLAGSRLLRGEEDAGRWELLLAGQTTRQRAVAGAAAGLGIGLLTLWAVTAAAYVAVGRSADPPFSVTAGLFTAMATVAAAAMFLAAAALFSQLAATRRQAAGLAATAFGVAYLVRVIAYSGTSLRWLHWATPLGWVDELRPLTGSRLLPLVPIVATITALVALTIVLAGRRDLGAGTLAARDTAAPRTRYLNDPLGLAYRLGLRTTLGWIAGLTSGGIVMGLSTNSMKTVWENQSGGVVQRLGGATGSAAYLGLVFLVVAILVGMAAAGQAAATREEEAEGHLDHLLARPVARLPWLAGRFAVSAATLASVGVLTGVATWVGAAIGGARLSFPTLLAAGVNVVPAGVLVLGIGTLVHGLAPRFVATAGYGLVAWSLLVELVGASLGLSSWLLDLSILHHIARAPAAEVRWDSAAVMVAIGLIAAAFGAHGLARRDLEGA